MAWDTGVTAPLPPTTAQVVAQHDAIADITSPAARRAAYEALPYDYDGTGETWPVTRSMVAEVTYEKVVAQAIVLVEEEGLPGEDSLGVLVQLAGSYPTYDPDIIDWAANHIQKYLRSSVALNSIIPAAILDGLATGDPEPLVRWYAQLGPYVPGQARPDPFPYPG